MAMQREYFKRDLAHPAWQMSGNNRPSAARQETSLPGHLREENTTIPVTPSEESCARPGTASGSGNAPKHVLEAVGASGQPEYFSDRADSANGPSSAQEAANGAKNGEDILRRLSLTGSQSKPDFDSIDPRTAHPGLGLSGNIISATFAVPYKVGYTTSGEWVGSTVEL